MLFASDAFKTSQHLVGLFFLFFIASCGNDDGEAVNSSNNPDDSASDKYGMSLIWSDEFDYDGSVDNLKWHHQVIPIMGSSWANGEVQHYTNREENSYVSDGTLKIVAKKEQYNYNGNTKSYTSARLNTKYAFQYGRIDISAKLPVEQGTWPAFWTLGANINERGNYHGSTYGSVGWPACGEIDIMETRGRISNISSSALHFGFSPDKT